MISQSLTNYLAMLMISMCNVGTHTYALFNAIYRHACVIYISNIFVHT